MDGCCRRRRGILALLEEEPRTMRGEPDPKLNILSLIVGASALLTPLGGCPPPDPCSGVVCDDGDACTTDTCDPNLGCVYTDIVCDEGEVCIDGECQTPACESDLDCDDGLFCNGEETCVDGSCVAGTNPCAVAEDALIAKWNLDGDAVDATGNGHDGVVYGATPAEDRLGNPASAMQFDGVNDYIEVPDSDQWAFGARDFTIALWAAFSSPGGGSVGQPGDVFIGNDEGPYTRNKWFFALGGGVLNFHINGPGTGSVFMPRVPFSPIVDQWYHLAVTRNGSTYTIFVDGGPAGSAEDTRNIPNANSPLMIGRANEYWGGFMNGRLDEIAIYDRALSESELQVLAGSGSGEPPAQDECCDEDTDTCLTPSECAADADHEIGLVAHYPFNGNADDASGNGHDGTVIGAALAADRFGNSDSAYCLDGVDDYINIGNGVKPPLPVTVSLWIKVNALHPVQTPVFRNDSVDHAAYRYGVDVGFVPDGRAFAHTFEGFAAPWNRRSVITVNTVAVSGEWIHMAVVYQSYDELHVFVNGVEEDVTYSDGTGSSMTYSSSGDGAIGMEYGGDGARYYDGCVDDVRVYDRALSNEEIEALPAVLSDTSP